MRKPPDPLKCTNIMQITDLSIGGLVLENPLILAPMAGITDLAYRQIHKQFGAGLVTTEMVSAAGLIQGGPKTFELLRSDPAERPLSIQLFGSDPDTLAEAARRVEAYGDLIDINMGCPVKKVIKGGAGVALMQDPGRIGQIVTAVRKAIRCPLTVKIRSGWDQSSINYLDIGRIAEQAGADAVTLHPRTRTQMFSGHSDWQQIRQLREALTVPVIGSGDIFSAEDGLRMLQETGCAGLMIGRGGYGNPWIFQQLRAGLAGKPLSRPTLAERLNIALEHCDRAETHLSPHKAMLEMRKHLCWYTKGLAGAGAFRSSLQHIATLDEMRHRLSAFFEQAAHEESC